MAIKASAATGNWLTAGTWGLIDSTSYLNSETGTQTVTTAYSGSTSANFTPGAITVDGIYLKLRNRTGTTGTITVHLEIATVEVTGTAVTINTADLPAAVSADLNGGWIFFKFASSVLLLAATNYNVAVKTSSSSQVDLFRDGTAGNVSRALRTTTTGAPAAGDDVIIAGEYLSAGSSNTLTVTMDETAATDYGAASTSLVTPAISICSKGVLAVGTTASTAYQLKVSGCVVGYIGGTFNAGTVGTEMPRNSSFKMIFDSAANVDFGFTARNGFTWTMQGLSRTSGKDIDRCKLNTDEAANSTSLGVDTDTGWLDNDEIAVASTSQTSTQCEKGTMNGAASSTTLTVDGFAGSGGGLLNAHSGTSPTQAEVILLTRNIQIVGASASLQGYIDIKATATISWKWAEFYWMGSATANKRGIDIATTTGTLTIDRCSFHDFTVASSRGFNVSATSGSGINVTNCVTFKIAAQHLVIPAHTGTWIFNGNIFMLTTDGGVETCSILDIGGTFYSNTMTGATGAGLTISEFQNTSGGTFDTNTFHSNADSGVKQSTCNDFVMSNVTAWRNINYGINCIGKQRGCTFGPMTAFGNSLGSLQTQDVWENVKVNSLTSNGDTTFATDRGFYMNQTNLILNAVFSNCDFGTVSGIKTAHGIGDVVFTAVVSCKLVFRNCKFASTTEFSNTVSNMLPGSYIALEKHDQTAGDHLTYKTYGTIAIETTTVHTGSQSVKMTPNNSAKKLESPSFFAAVANGQTVTPTVWINKGATYNGNQPRLIVKANAALGIDTDTVLATYSAGTGSWNSISAATATVNDDGVLEFIVDCDGTVGSIFVDSISVA